jgi:hypothetical protein
MEAGTADVRVGPEGRGYNPPDVPCPATLSCLLVTGSTV